VKLATELMTKHLRLTEVLTLQSLKLQDAAVAQQKRLQPPSDAFSSATALN
jgi:hypothetical protein